jgi:hypothetical protein
VWILIAVPFEPSDVTLHGLVFTERAGARLPAAARSSMAHAEAAEAR